MVSKRVEQLFTKHFSEIFDKEIDLTSQREHSSQFSFQNFTILEHFEYNSQLIIDKNTTSKLEIKENAGIIATIVIEKDTEFDLHFYAHSNSCILLKCIIKEGATCNILGNYLAQKDKNWIFIELLHEGEKSASDLKVLGYSSNNAQCINDGLVQIGRNAQNSSGYQTMTNYVLSNTSKVFSEPKLEIFNPNVMCSHGSTISPIEKETLYYLESRGISQKQSIQLLEESMYDTFMNS